MNVKKFLIAGAVIYVVLHAIGYLVHMVLLSGTYMALATLWRPDMMSYMWVMWLASLVYAFLFVYIFIKGYENKGIAEGARYGLVVGLFMAVPGIFGQFVVYPIPLSLALTWLFIGIAESIIYGVIAAAIYRPK